MSFEDFVKRAFSALNEANLEYVIIGGLVAIIYGRLRSTADLDVAIKLQPSETESIAKLVSAFRKHDLDVLESEIVASLREKSRFFVFDTKSPLRVDAKGVYTRLDSKTLENRRREKVLGLEVWVASPEDTIISKLIYGSPQDIEDALAIMLNLRDKIDYEYLNRQAEIENVRKQLKELLHKLQ
ncbi:MAG: nucleotidyltransferase [Candidatus Jordarchaeaceae archaeon]